MGTWGLGTFDDDIACDWIEDLYDSDPLAFFIQCLDLSGQQEPDFLACIGVVCTAEMLQGLLAQPREGLPEAARRWLQGHGHLEVARLVPDAVRGLRRVLRPESEMHQLWQDNEEMYDAWMARTQDLLSRLEATIAKGA